MDSVTELRSRRLLCDSRELKLLAGENMVSIKQPPIKSSSPLFQMFHLVFTILSIAALSYKVFRLESELSFIRAELSTFDSNGDKKANLPLFTTAKSEIETRSDRNRRRIIKSGMYGVKQKIQDAVCIRKALQNFQVNIIKTSPSRLILAKGYTIHFQVFIPT